MSTTIELNKENGYLIVTQTGQLDPQQIKEARETSLPMFQYCDRALVDYRKADLSGLRLIDLDDLSAEFHQDVPDCKKMAIIRTQGIDDDYYAHLRNVCSIKGVETELFTSEERAEEWLLLDKT
ncbi:MAG: hypothetical protein OQK12_00640 [Motiliproteus sp.]|nr:hypothetical protein [Motiliproteus sp.]MCW9053427.1 hypothetical protein [Motiliproteus sp.]